MGLAWSEPTTWWGYSEGSYISYGPSYRSYSRPYYTRSHTMRAPSIRAPSIRASPIRSMGHKRGGGKTRKNK